MSWDIKKVDKIPYTKEEQENHKHIWITCPMCGGEDSYVSGKVCSDPRCESSAEQAICCGC